MRFVCSERKFEVLEMTAEVLGVEHPFLKKFVEIEDDKLIAIARTLGMEELSPTIVLNPDTDSTTYDAAMKILGFENGSISNEEAIQRLGIGELISPAPENEAGMPKCEICGKPVKSKRAKTCSDECTREKQRRYARDYYHRKDKTTEDAGGGDSPPLAQAEETFSSREWGSDPGDEPVRRAGGL